MGGRALDASRESGASDDAGVERPFLGERVGGVAIYLPFHSCRGGRASLVRVDAPSDLPPDVDLALVVEERTDELDA